MARHAQLSAAAYGSYLLLLGTGVAAAPHKMRALFNSILVSGKLPPVGEGDQSLWCRAFGILTAYVGMYYLQAARHNLVPIFELTAIGRTVILPAFHVALYLTGKVPFAWLEAAIPSDFLTACHMMWCLRRDRLLQP